MKLEDKLTQRRKSSSFSQRPDTSPTYKFLHSKSVRTDSTASAESSSRGTSRDQLKERFFDFFEENRQKFNNRINFQGMKMNKMNFKKADLNKMKNDFSARMRWLRENLVQFTIWSKFLLRLLAITLISIVVTLSASTLLTISILCDFIGFQTLINLTRYLGDLIQRTWVNSCLFLFPTPNLHLTGDFPKNGSPKILICNHSTEADWFYVWMLTKLVDGKVGQIDYSGNLKITLKDELKNIPIFGWGCLAFQFIFLKRKWEFDEATIISSVNRFMKSSSPTWFLIFPEGNTVNTSSVMKCKEFAKKNSRPVLDKVLLPRRKGLEAIIGQMKKALSPEEFKKVELFDLTMSFKGYSGEVPTWEMGYSRRYDTMIPTIKTYIMGTSSRDCCFQSTKFTMEEIFDKNKNLELFLDKRWIQKEKDLTYFANAQSYVDGVDSVVQIKGNITDAIGLSLMYGALSYLWYQLFLGHSDAPFFERLSQVLFE
eukprot:maker-scaffold_1-snap-gene-24.14-mRNA-1 protein AED:0.01 eAED:0.01 QI:115/1/1/1/1/1/3/173/483